jgi:SpoVK/Ycf46/Vps4 family AAA+-type ATPase
MLNWQKNLFEFIETQQYTVLILHGSIRDLIRLKDQSYGALTQYLQEIFGKKDYFIQYDPAQGIDFPNKEQKREFYRTLEAYDRLHNTNFAQGIPKNPGSAFLLLENFIKLQAIEGKSSAVIIDYIEDILPEGDRVYLSNEIRYCLVAVDKWSRDLFFLKKDITIILTVENLALLVSKITKNNFIPKIEILLPDDTERLKYLSKLQDDYKKVLDLSLESAAKLSSGLSLGQLKHILSYAHKNSKTVDAIFLKDRKKEAIEAECLGLLEFIEPGTNLDMVAGHSVVKEKFRQAAQALKVGHTEVLPMGYLISGPVGTGKTYLVTSFAGEIGVPVVQLMNFRSRWVGATEANLDKILNLLKSMWPVAVVIDEADAFLGQRDAGGDSGTSSRVFARLMSFMGNTEYRGKIIWFLITCRPDILPIDIKRQGRAEEHFALFYPERNEDKEAIFTAMCKKLSINRDNIGSYSQLFPKNIHYSGADIEAILTRAKFLCFVRKVENIDKRIISEVISDFIPPSYPEEVELQNLVAVKECTSRRMLPERYKKMSGADITKRIEQLLTKV